MLDFAAIGLIVGAAVFAIGHYVRREFSNTTDTCAHPCPGCHGDTDAEQPLAAIGVIQRSVNR